MIINIVLILIIVFLLIYLFKCKKELMNISNQIDNSEGEYINIHTEAINSTIEDIVIKVNNLYNNSQKIVAKNKEIEEELRKSIANISHDLRTPLTSIIGYIQLIKDEFTTGEERKEYIEIIERRAANLQSLITSFYDLSRLHSNEFKFNFSKINLKTILCNNVADFYNDFINNKIEPIIEIDDYIEDIISDESAINRVFVNLIGNMIKHSSGIVKIALYKEDKYIVSSFTNSAPNLNEEDIEKIFQRFYTADNSRADRNTGLGLAIAKEIVNQLGNIIEAELENGKIIIKIKWVIK